MPSIDDLIAQAGQALMRSDPRGALDLLAQARALDPADPRIPSQTALARRVIGDLPGAVRALDEALALNPYDFVALLSKGALLEKLGAPRLAADVYRKAVEAAPADIPAPLQAPFNRAREMVAQTADALAAFLREQLAELRAQAGEPPKRFDQALDVFAGRRKVYVQEPLGLHYPGLPAVEFYDRDLFPWLPQLEAATDIVRGELEALVASRMDDFVPYIARPPGEPVGQWGELNHSRRWTSLFLWKDGARDDATCAACPQTAALLDTLPMADQPGFAPTAVFSALQGGAHIPPHTGSTNARLLVHLPLILPGPARFRVGGETRQWRMGQAWVFDDTIEHEAWNDADALRVILIFDVWNPHLDETERALVRQMMLARRAFFQAP